jgi:Dolichyl-phosphate-mannose-protein mannosyltransferase
MVLPRLRRLAGEHKLFTAALAVGTLLRLITSIGYPGALWFAGDSYVYIGAALRPEPNLSKATGYSFFLRLLLPFHSFTLVTGVQHVMGLLIAVMIYVLLRRNGVSKTWSALATLPQLLDGYIIEDEHLIMTETVFTFLLMIALLILLWNPRPRWWTALVAGLLVGAAMAVRTEGEAMLAVLPLFLLLRGWAWKTLRGWGIAIVLTVGMLIPFGAYTTWFHVRNPQLNTSLTSATLSTGYYLWGRVSSFANCAVIKPTGQEAQVCPTQPIVDRDPPGNYIWHAPYVHADMDDICTDIVTDGKKSKDCGPVSPAGNKVLTDFAIKAVLAQPLDYVKTVVKGVLLSFGFPRIGYPGSGTTYYYSFHFNYVGTDPATGKPISLLPPKTEAWVSPLVVPKDSAYDDWLNYGHQAPGVVNKIFAAPIAVYQRVVFTYGPLLAVIFLLGLGGLFSVTARRRGTDPWSPRHPVRALRSVQLSSVRLRWAPRGTSMLPWVAAVALLVAPIAVADFDYRYLIPVIPFACMAAGLSFAPRRSARGKQATPAAPADIESTVPDQVG